jgi:hypothetical protein
MGGVRETNAAGSPAGLAFQCEAAAIDWQWQRQRAAALRSRRPLLSPFIFRIFQHNRSNMGAFCDRAMWFRRPRHCAWLLPRRARLAGNRTRCAGGGGLRFAVLFRTIPHPPPHTKRHGKPCPPRSMACRAWHRPLAERRRDPPTRAEGDCCRRIHFPCRRHALLHAGLHDSHVGAPVRTGFYHRPNLQRRTDCHDRRGGSYSWGAPFTPSISRRQHRIWRIGRGRSHCAKGRKAHLKRGSRSLVPLARWYTTGRRFATFA